HLVRAGAGLFADWNYAIDVERGFGETLQYVKLGWLVVILPLLAVRLRSGQFACWAVIALVLLYDDMFSARERYGQVLALAQGWEGAFGIRGQDLGEFVFIGLYGVVVLACAALAYRYSRGGDRRFWWEMGVLLVALVGFGIVVDMIHVLVIGQEPWDLLLATIEDGGEMVVASLMVRLTFERWDRTDQPLAGAARSQA
ncbi:MAG TPA: hypothetical protein VLA76_11795, partial [Candidatus Angelobacter sp.]|nr:hypothetical protein [Candidatus Angelobacter sp.]